jgi:hypothetical protein
MEASDQFHGLAALYPGKESPLTIKGINANGEQENLTLPGIEFWSSRPQRFAIQIEPPLLAITTNVFVIFAYCYTLVLSIKFNSIIYLRHDPLPPLTGPLAADVTYFGPPRVLKPCLGIRYSGIPCARPLTLKPCYYLGYKHFTLNSSCLQILGQVEYFA